MLSAIYVSCYDWSAEKQDD